MKVKKTIHLLDINYIYDNSIMIYDNSIIIYENTITIYDESMI